MRERPSFVDLDCQSKRRRTRWEEFLERMNSLIPWGRLEEGIEPHYFRGARGRRPYPLSVMLRVHVVQLCYNPSDPAMEDPRLRGAGSVVRSGVGAGFCWAAVDIGTDPR